MKLLVQLISSLWNLGVGLYDLGVFLAPKPLPKMPVKTAADVVRPEPGELLVDHFLGS